MDSFNLCFVYVLLCFILICFVGVLTLTGNRAPVGAIVPKGA